MELKLEEDGKKPATPAAPAKPAAAAKPAQSKLYQPAVALQFFKTAGKVESIAQGKPIFVENEGGANLYSEGARMYLLLDGQVALSVRKKPVGGVRKGEIFGELAPISQFPRTATAVAATACKVISVNEKQFQDGIAKSPDFAIMLMSIIINRLRETIAKLTSGGALSEQDPWNKATMFDRKLLADLQREFEDKPPALHPLNKVIMKEGDRGIFMYAVLDGTVAVSIGGKLVEMVGPGGVFGEMALIDQNARVATATAESDCTLLAINRNDFLNMIRTKPAFALSLLKALSERLRFMTSKVK
ncbi:MAG: cyclic nucleotide-binding domain-containing protein [Betaproteobacteria bacterium]|nr:cyclic nucleotide-binding domain-containing protein [Betaproteobacteria bacterium]